MSPGSALLFTAIAVPTYDWLSVTGGASKMTSFDYVYWPPSRLRAISIALLAVGGFTTALLVKPPEADAGLWKLLPAFVAMAVHCGVAIHDLFLQRRIARAAGDAVDA